MANRATKDEKYRMASLFYGHEIICTEFNMLQYDMVQIKPSYGKTVHIWWHKTVLIKTCIAFKSISRHENKRMPLQ